MQKIFLIPLIISVTAFVAFVVGLFNPTRAIFWSQEKTRIKSIAYLIVGVIFGVIWILVR